MSDVLIVKRPVVASATQKTPVAAAATMLAMVGLGDARGGEQEQR